MKSYPKLTYIIVGPLQTKFTNLLVRLLKMLRSRLKNELKGRLSSSPIAHATEAQERAVGLVPVSCDRSRWSYHYD